MAASNDWRPCASLDTLRQRAAWLKTIRDFFYAQGVLEVQTPALGMSGSPDPGIANIEVNYLHYQAYLQSSPECFMKRLLAAGSGPIYQIGQVFRHDPPSVLHQPEFTLLEWYRPGFSQSELILELQSLLETLLKATIGFQSITYRQLFQQYTHIDPYRVDWQRFQRLYQDHGLPKGIGEDWQMAMDWLLSIVIQPQMRGWTQVHSYPIRQAMLAKAHPEDQHIAHQFELYFNGVEIANGFEELTDAKEQQRRFADGNRQRVRLGLPTIVLDEHFLQALESGLPQSSGVAVGLDRLLHCYLGTEHIHEVMSFAWPV